MNMEKRDMVPKSNEEIEAFMEIFTKTHADVVEMLKKGKAYFQDTRDEKGNLRSYKIFKNDGELLFYENLEGLSNSEPKFLGKKLS